MRRPIRNSVWDALDLDFDPEYTCDHCGKCFVESRNICPYCDQLMGDPPEFSQYIRITQAILPAIEYEQNYEEEEEPPVYRQGPQAPALKYDGEPPKQISVPAPKQTNPPKQVKLRQTTYSQGLSTRRCKCCFARLYVSNFSTICFMCDARMCEKPRFKPIKPKPPPKQLKQTPVEIKPIKQTPVEVIKPITTWMDRVAKRSKIIAFDRHRINIISGRQ